MIELAFLIAYGVLYAGRQVGTDARTGVRSLRREAVRRTTVRAADIRRRGWRSPAWWALMTGTAVWVTGRATVRGARAAHRSVRTGWQAGTVRGREQHGAYVARRQERAEARRADPFAYAVAAPYGSGSGGGVGAETARASHTDRTDEPPMPRMGAEEPDRTEGGAPSGIHTPGGNAESKFRPGSRVRDRQWGGTHTGTVTRVADEWIFVQWDAAAFTESECTEDELELLLGSGDPTIRSAVLPTDAEPVSGESPRPGPQPQWVCPECGEPAVPRPPTSWTPAWGRRPSWSHADGEPLCPVMTAAGYAPADPEPLGLDPGRPAGDTTHSEGEPVHPTTSSGASMGTGEATNIEAARDTLVAIRTAAGEAVSTIDTLSASLASADIDPETLGEVAEILEAATTMQAAADKAVQGLNTRHAALEEAVNSTPHAAATDFYRH